MYKRTDGLFEKVITIDGKRIPFRAKTEKEVMRKILEYNGKIEKGRTFKEVAEEWKDEHFKTIAYNSTKNYKPAFDRAITKFGKRYVKEIKANEVQAFITAFSKTMAQKTVSTQLLVVNLIFSKAVLDGEIEYSPSTYVKVPRGLPKQTRSTPADEVIKKIKESVNCDFGLFAFLILYTGCRRGEALALQYKDIDYSSKIINITKSIYHVNNNPFIKLPKTKSGIRSIILLDKLIDVLPKGKANDYIFTDTGDKPLTQKRFSTKWSNYCKSIGISDVTPHQLRHGYATMLFEAGINEKDAQELLGHSSLAMTRDIYTHIRAARKTETANKLNQFNA